MIPNPPSARHLSSERRIESPQVRGQTIGDYVLQGQIGQGAFGIIHRCRSLKDNSTYVVKEIKIGVDGGGKNVSLKEAILMQKIKHRHIVKYHDCL